MKKTKFIGLLTVLGLLFLLLKCESNKDLEPYIHVNSSIDNQAFIQSINDHQELIQSDRISLSMLSNSTSSELFETSSIQLRNDNLNHLVNSYLNDIDVVSISAFSKNDTNIGYLVYYISDAKMFLKVDLPDMKETLRVNGIILQDMLFLQEKNCVGCDIFTLKARTGTLDHDKLWNNSYSDMALLRFNDKYFKLKENHQNSIWEDNHIDNEQSVMLEKTFQFSPAYEVCGITHHCRNPGGSSCDVWRSFCFDISTPACAYETIFENGVAGPSMPMQYSVNPSLPSPGETKELNSQNLYSVRESLNQTSSGQVYVEGYYLLSNHFKSSLNTSIVSDVLSMSGDLYNLVNKYLSGSNEVLFNDSFYYKVKNVMLQSRNNSTSQAYRETVDIMLYELSQYKNISVNQVKLKLNTRF
ncbi:hypothetical protein [Roseivirga pacifica]|uniref:hypothetical protein n=1 Tax=Roseivirga pacifica TaxID=1267423 RepID=UPI00227AA6F9|nr:hypothetical protein [Roseivirga pacifica]